MSSKHDAPKAQDVDESKLQYFLSLYPTVLKSFYQQKVKGDDKKRQEAFQDDEWRYKDLPSAVQRRKQGVGLTKAELERLVKWKITHQTNRPFLLPQIRKNDAKAVERCTAEARQFLLDAKSTKSDRSEIISQQDLRKALDKVCELSGVGPATGTLLLSIFDGHNIPFFEDELYAWLVVPDAGSKLKYNVKEYFELIDKFRENVKANISDEDSSIKLAMIYEKVAFVSQHWDLVEESSSPEVDELAGEQMDQELIKNRKNTAPVASGGSQEVLASGKGSTKAKRKNVGSEDTVGVARRSKRTKN